MKEGGVILSIDIRESKESKIELEPLEIRVPDGMTAGLYFLQEHHRNAFVEILKGRIEKNITIQLEDIIQNKDILEYRRNIDVIANVKIESTLSCREYVYMYCMIRKGYNPSTEEGFDHLLENVHLEEMKDKKMGELSSGWQTIIRGIAAYLQGCKLIVLQDGMESYLAEERYVLYNLIQKYMKKQGICLILSTRIEELKDITNLIYQMDRK